MRHPVLVAFFASVVWVSTIAGEGVDLVRKGEDLLKAGQIAEAVATLKQAVAQAPDSSLAYTRLGGAQVLHQEYDAGIESFKRAISLDGTNAEAFVGMAVAYIHTARYPLARAALEEAKRIEPSKREKIDELIAWIDERVQGEGR
jgi:tetratricopeptide (TPR) repeat protein